MLYALGSVHNKWVRQTTLIQINHASESDYLIRMTELNSSFSMQNNVCALDPNLFFLDFIVSTKKTGVHGKKLYIKEISGVLFQSFNISNSMCLRNYL